MKGYLQLTCLFIVFNSCSKTSILPNEPNVLWLIIEDFSPDLSCYGNEDVQTPNIDMLASEGLMYKNAFTTAPVCSASRSAIITGMYQTTLGAHHHRSNRDGNFPLPDSILTAPQYYQEVGYYTANIKHGFDSFKGTGKKDLNFTHKKIFQGNHWDSLNANQPFYAQINFAPVHRMLYKMPDTLTVIPDSIQLPPYYPDHPVARKDWAEYLTKAELLDHMIGEVLEKLERDKLLNNTIIFLMSDHGRNHIRGKQWLYDPGIHIPLIVRMPQGPKGRVNNKMISAIDILPTSLVLSGIEIPNHIQGIPFLADTVDSREFLVAARDRCDESIEYIRCVRDQEFKYIKNFWPEIPYSQTNKYKEAYYPMWLLIQRLHQKGQLKNEQAKFLAPQKPSEELYDIRKDPYELNNLANNPAYDSILNLMRTRLSNWQEQTNDLGRVPEDSEQLKNWIQKIEQWDVSDRIETIQKQIRKYDK